MKKLIFLSLSCCLLFTIHPWVVDCSLSYSAVLLDRVVAIVNGDVITWSELRRTIEQEDKELLKGLVDKEKEKTLKELEKTFLNNMIDVKLQLQEAQKKGIDVKDSEVEEAVSNIKKKYNLKDEDLMASLNTEGFTLEEYKAKLREQILLSKVVMNEVRSNVLVTDKEIEEFYNSNKDEYNKKESVKVRQIFFNAPRDETQKVEIEAKSHEIMKRLKAGEDFARLAEEFSEDIGRKSGGDLGYISRGSVLKEIEDVVFNLKEGEISKPFWSSKGLHIIKVEHGKIKEEIKDLLLEKAFRLKYEEWLKDLRSKAYIEVKL